METETENSIKETLQARQETEQRRHLKLGPSSPSALKTHSSVKCESLIVESGKEQTHKCDFFQSRIYRVFGLTAPLYFLRDLSKSITPSGKSSITPSVLSLTGPFWKAVLESSLSKNHHQTAPPPRENDVQTPGTCS